MHTAQRTLLTSLLLAAAGVALLGCKSADKPASASFASVRIAGHTRTQIRNVTMSVFQDEGYVLAGVDGSDLVFEKEGSTWDRVAYGNWIDDKPVWVRVKVSLVPLSEGVFRLQCQAFKVRDKGDAVFEEELRLRGNRSKPYQAVLDKVLGQLGRS